MNSQKKKVNTTEKHIEELLQDLKEHLSNFQLTIDSRYKTIQEYIRLKANKNQMSKII